uniref:Peptidase_M13 domain-containing protein n=1 Tax=Strongyloides papillosus TaxID=174720 RepID=A0A0N5C274_STREA
MNVLTIILYTYAFFFVSQGGIVFKVDRDNPNGPIIIDFESESLNTTLETANLNDYVDPEVKPCDNFYLFSCEFYKGKLNNKSRTIKNLHNLLTKCYDQPEASIADCQSTILNFGNYATSSLFLNENKIKSEKNGDYNIIEDMIKRIKEEFRLLIDEKKDIFDEETRKHFLYKLDKMKFVKNYDEDYLFNVTLMEDCYDSVGINYNDTIENIFETIKHYKTLPDNDKDNLKPCKGKMFPDYEYLRNYVFSNAFYFFRKNIFSINSDYLNEPSFSRNFPMSLNYGNIGHTIAHEILHGFDSDSYNPEIRNNNKFNFTQMSIENFKEKSDCFVKQYGMQKESITNKSINGLLSLDENIADNGGLKIAHRAYMKYLQSIGGKDLLVSGFEDFTDEQLFFISFGRSECEYKSKNYLEKQINNSEHPPSEIRINVALSNYKPFYEVFECKINSKMNSEDKCELWKNQKQN